MIIYLDRRDYSNCLRWPLSLPGIQLCYEKKNNRIHLIQIPFWIIYFETLYTGDTLEDYLSLWRQYDLNHDRCLEFKVFVFCLTTWKLSSFQRVFCILRTRNFLNDDKSDDDANVRWEVDQRRFTTNISRSFRNSMTIGL